MAKLWYANQIADLARRGPSDASRQYVSLGEYTKVERALTDLLSHCDVKPEGETAFEKAVIRGRSLIGSARSGRMDNGGFASEPTEMSDFGNSGGTEHE